jgi:hypothetical protein
MTSYRRQLQRIRELARQSRRGLVSRVVKVVVREARFLSVLAKVDAERFLADWKKRIAGLFARKQASE